MPTALQEPITGSDATYTSSGARIALDVDIGSNLTFNIGSVNANVDSVYVQSGTMYITSGANLTGSFAVTTSPVPISGNVNVSNEVTINGSVYSTGSFSLTTNPVPISGFINSIISGTPQVFVDTRANTSNSYNPSLSLVYSGTVIGSVYKNTGTGSTLQVLSYDASDNLINVSAWSVV